MKRKPFFFLRAIFNILEKRTQSVVSIMGGCCDVPPRSCCRNEGDASSAAASGRKLSAVSSFQRLPQLKRATLFKSTSSFWSSLQPVTGWSSPRTPTQTILNGHPSFRDLHGVDWGFCRGCIPAQLLPLHPFFGIDPKTLYCILKPSGILISISESASQGTKPSLCFVSYLFY